MPHAPQDESDKMCESPTYWELRAVNMVIKPHISQGGGGGGGGVGVYFDWCITFSSRFKILISTSKNAILVARRASCRVTNAFSTTLKLIWPRSSLKTTKMYLKTHFWQKAPGVNGLRARSCDAMYRVRESKSKCNRALQPHV